MDSRQSAFLFFTAFLLLAGFCSAKKICRCTSDQRCFPTSKDWSDLNNAVGGRLLQARPPAYFCHDTGYNAAACEDAKKNWQDAAWRSNQVGASQRPLWESYHDHSCFINSSSSTTCHQGSVPLYAVNVTYPLDISMALIFVKNHNIRLVIKNTGHDYLGRSFGRDSLSLWMHNLKTITFHDRFTQDHCSESGSPIKAVTVEAGVQWGELYRAAQKHNRVVVGAFSNTVGASGGYVQGGGHSVIAPTYRFGSDNAIQFEVVTPDGVYRVVNRCQNQELFWALRGGGGGTFGVVLSTTYVTHDPPSNFLNVVHSVTANDSSVFRDFLAAFVRLQPKLSDALYGGSFSAVHNGLHISYVLPGGESDEAVELWKPLVDFAKDNSGIQVTQTLHSFADFFSFFNATQCARFPHCSDLTGNNEVLTSHLIPRHLFEDSSYAVADAIVEIVNAKDTKANKFVLGMSVGGGNAAASEDSAMNPAWRSSLWHMIVNGAFPDGSSEEEKAALFFDVSHAGDVMRRLVGAPGAYVNEADYLELDWQASFWGCNYPRLLKLKMSVDPSQHFICHHCVGSEKWDEDLICRTP